MRMVDADALINMLQKLFDKREKEQIFTGRRGVVVTWNDAIYHIKSAPTVDAVPVVRCRECKYYVARGLFGEERHFCTSIYQRLCGDLNYVEYEPPEDWFCADGKRKDGADNG